MYLHRGYVFPKLIYFQHDSLTFCGRDGKSTVFPVV